MSEQPEQQQLQKPQPNPLSFLKFRHHDEKAQIIRDLITSDKNNPVKARTPTVFGMVMLMELGMWDAPSGTMYPIGDQKKYLDGTIAGDQQFFYEMYNQISQSYQGLARQEYERAASSWLAQAQAMQQGAQQARMEEGVKSKK